MSEFIRNAWHVGALSNEIGPDQLFTRRLLEVPVLFYRLRETDAPVAMLDRCHTASPISPRAGGSATIRSWKTSRPRCVHPT